MALLLIRSNALWTPPNTMSMILSVEAGRRRRAASRTSRPYRFAACRARRSVRRKAARSTSLSSPDRSGSRRTPKRTRPASAIALPSAAFFRLTSRTSSARKREASKVMRAGPTDASMSSPRILPVPVRQRRAAAPSRFRTRRLRRPRRRPRPAGRQGPPACSRQLSSAAPGPSASGVRGRVASRRKGPRDR